jgi:hypothetical protein
MVAHSHTQMREAVFYSTGRAVCERFAASSRRIIAVSG